MKINRNSKSIFYISTFVSSLMVVFLNFITLFALLSLLQKINIVQITGMVSRITGMFSETMGAIPDAHYEFFGALFFQFLYLVIEMFLILYSICFFLTRFESQKKLFFIVIFILILISLIFGQALNNYFFRPKLSLSDETSIYNGNSILWYRQTSFFLKELFLPTLVFPFYPSSQKAIVLAQESLMVDAIPEKVINKEVRVIVYELGSYSKNITLLIKNPNNYWWCNGQYFSYNINNGIFYLTNENMYKPIANNSRTSFNFKAWNIIILTPLIQFSFWTILFLILGPIEG